MKTILSAIALSAALAAITAPAFAQDHSSHAGHGSAPAASAASADVMTAGEITRIDARTGKLTIRHEEIKNLDMPPMTMVFVVKDPNQLKGLKVGDRVQFTAEQLNGAYTATSLEPIR